MKNTRKKTNKKIVRITLDEALTRTPKLRKGEKTAAQLRRQADVAIDFSDSPELTQEFWKNARMLRPTTKRMMTLRLDDEVVKWFKGLGKGYQSHMNGILRAYIETQRH